MFHFKNTDIVNDDIFEEILVNKEYTTQLGTIELICDFDCVLELMDKNIFVRALPITKKSLFKIIHI